MEIAVIIVFLAIFGGIAFLGFLIWLIFRIRKSLSANNRQFADTSAKGTYINSYNSETTNDDSDDFIYSDNSLLDIEESSESRKSAEDSSFQIESQNFQPIQSEYTPPAEYISAESTSSYDSGGSSDSGSSDSGSSWSSD